VARELKPQGPYSAAIAAPKVQFNENLDVFKIEIVFNPAILAGCGQVLPEDGDGGGGLSPCR
jgi:hypothetical protein